MRNNTQLQTINFNTKAWQDWKMSQPNLNNYLRSVAIGMIFSYASMEMRGKHANMKIEQSRDQYFFVHNLFYLFNPYTFYPHIAEFVWSNW